MHTLMRAIRPSVKLALHALVKQQPKGGKWISLLVVVAVAVAVTALYGTYTEVQIATFTNCLPNLGVVLAGGRSSGVIVKAILPGSFAYKDGQIKQGDHLLAVNDVFVHGMTCDQVANLLRHNADGKIQMIVGRALKSSTSAKKHSRTTIRLPTDVVTNPALLKNHITNLNADFGHKSSVSIVTVGLLTQTFVFASTERYQSAIVEPSKQQDVTASAPQHTGSRNDELENLSSQACLVNRRKVDKKTVQSCLRLFPANSKIVEVRHRQKLIQIDFVKLNYGVNKTVLRIFYSNLYIASMC
ncbi:putative patj-like protein [Trichinella spiralis]|uniref:putative patj-like protein n=1 Tax=Trichinella spiralis TaxID=6334 RepID=UPI0001EFE87A|nr:putative patj-like protein [Trichinella spiralis]